MMETVGLQVKKTVKTYPNKTAVIYKDRSITYKELYYRAMALTSFLKKQGLKKGDRIAVLLSNRLEHIELDLVAAFGGFIKVPLNFRLHPEEHEYMIHDAEVAYLIGEKELISPIDVQVPTLFVGELYEEIIENHLGEEYVEEVDEDDEFVIMYTSGTTGKPKGVVLTHRNIASATLAISLVTDVTKDDVIGHVAPLSHGSNFLSHLSWLNGNTQIIYNKFDPEEFIDDIEKDGVTVIFLVPTMINLMIQHPNFDPKKLEKMKSIVMAGSAIAASKFRKAIELLGTKFVQMYGQAEAPMAITTMLRDEQLERVESCGKPSPFVDMKIVDSEMNELPPREIGEIVCKGSLVMKGYWKNEKATKETIVDGWLRTGDLGYVDENGYLYIVDRIKEVIISGGANIYPREVEEVLSKHKGVKEVAVVGVPDEKWGESVVAYVVPNGTVEVKEEELIELSKNHLASYKKPREVIITDRLPKNAYGKILKKELVKLYAQGVR